MLCTRTGVMRRTASIAGLLILLFVVLPAERSLAQPYEETVFRDAAFFIDIYGLFADTVFVSGSTDLHWSERYFNGVTDVIDMQMTGIALHGQSDPLGCVSIVPHASQVSWGQAMFPTEGGGWPAESFFDVFLQVLMPAHPPYAVLHTMTPIHIVSQIDQMPPFFCRYEMMPPAPAMLFNEGGLIVGEISLLWHDEMMPWSFPAARVSALASHDSDIAIVRDNEAVFSAGVAGWVEPEAGMPPCASAMPLSATFGIRPASAPVPFSTFFVDVDGAGNEIGTILPMRTGDGWAGYLNVAGFPPTGQRCDIEVIFDFGFMDMRDTTTVFISSAPPVPAFIGFSPDSIGFFQVDSAKSVVVAVPAAPLLNLKLAVTCLSPDFERELEIVEQDSLSEIDSIAAVACGPAAAASCLKYWATHGYPVLEHPGGDTSKPASTGTDIGKELVKDMDPRAENHGAQPPAIAAGIEKYLERHGCPGWKVSHHEIKDKTGLAGMERELETEGEDVIMIVSDTTRDKNGKLVRTGHAVTLGSRHAETYTAEKNGGMTLNTPQRVDFMDPRDGTGCSSNEYEVGTDAEGYPTTDGYTHTNGFSSARIGGYIKVSPPAAGSSGASAPGTRAAAGPAAAPAAPGVWVVVDSIAGRGNGLPDTLTWDTEGFPGGLYLLEAVATDAFGNAGKALRYAGIPQYNVIVGEDAPRPSETRITGVFPNPFNPSTRIGYVVASRAKVSVAVHDVSGRLVATLLDGAPREPGTYETAWNGLNEAGRRVASGVYFCRLTAGNAVATRKIVLMR